MPVRLRKEIDGFAVNRVQAAIIAESWRLVQVSPEEKKKKNTKKTINSRDADLTSRYRFS